MISFLISLLLIPTWAQVKTSAVLFDLNSNQKTALYKSTVEMSAPAADSKVSTAVFYRDLEDKIVVTEKGLIHGADLISYDIERPQTGEKGRIKVEAGKIYFEYEDAKGKKKTAEEKAKGPTVCSANFLPFVISQWEKIKSGQDVDVRFAVWDRLETVGFTIKKTAETEKNGQKVFELRMKPTSFVIAALVDPLYFWIAPDSLELKVMKGRVPVKQNKSGKWVDLDAEVVYTKN